MAGACPLLAPNMGKCPRCNERAARVKARSKTPAGEPYEIVECTKCGKLRRSYT